MGAVMCVLDCDEHAKQLCHTRDHVLLPRLCAYIYPSSRLPGRRSISYYSAYNNKTYLFIFYTSLFASLATSTIGWQIVITSHIHPA